MLMTWLQSAKKMILFRVSFRSETGLTGSYLSTGFPQIGGLRGKLLKLVGVLHSKQMSLNMLGRQVEGLDGKVKGYLNGPPGARLEARDLVNSWSLHYLLVSGVAR
jgi:hypothetical protein